MPSGFATTGGRFRAPHNNLARRGETIYCGEREGRAAAPAGPARPRPPAGAPRRPPPRQCHYMTQPLVELYGGCMVVLKVS
jgi:hypothetical protein